MSLRDTQFLVQLLTACVKVSHQEKENEAPLSHAQIDQFLSEYQTFVTKAHGYIGAYQQRQMSYMEATQQLLEIIADGEGFMGYMQQHADETQWNNYRTIEIELEDLTRELLEEEILRTYRTFAEVLKKGELFLIKTLYRSLVSHVQLLKSYPRFAAEQEARLELLLTEEQALMALLQVAPAAIPAWVATSTLPEALKAALLEGVMGY